ncbi:MAG: rod-binding protein [Clostridia bacterium]|nr:rod-binding protein [Clostridia bacterium]
MEIGGINDKTFNNTLNNAKNKIKQDDFEKRLQNAVDSKDDKELKKVCRDFEGIILNMMYKQMKATVPKTELLPGDISREIFDSMLDEKLMEEASRGRGIGLADMLYKQMSRTRKAD